MKIFKKLKQYKEEDAQGSLIGFGCIRAKDYDNEIYGHLILVSICIKKSIAIKKLFIPF
jgi:hypothetical protein